MATKTVHWQREECSTVSSWIVADGAQKVMDFITEVFAAHTMHSMVNDADKTIQHAMLKIGDTVVMTCDGNAEVAAFPAWLHVYVEDVDKTYALALSKGATSVRAPKDEFYGDRTGAVKDFAGNVWWIATHKFIPGRPDSKAQA